MPNMTGQIELNDLTVFLTVPTLALRDPLPFLMPPPIASAIESSLQGLEITVDTTNATMVRLLELVEGFEDEFKTHISDLRDPFRSPVGMHVWSGKAVIKADNTVEFEGELRRPVGTDYILYTELMSNLDAQAREDLLEHARHCPSCATRLGVKLASGNVPAEVLAACNFGNSETGQA